MAGQTFNSEQEFLDHFERSYCEPKYELMITNGYHLTINRFYRYDEDFDALVMLDRLLAWYTRMEEYERCAYLQNIRNEFEEARASYLQINHPGSGPFGPDFSNLIQRADPDPGI